MERGSWTKSLRVLSLEAMDRLIQRPASAIVSDPRDGSVNTFQGIREKLVKKKYAAFVEWGDDVIRVIQLARASEDPLVVDVCNDLEAYFRKEFGVLQELSEFRFKTALTRVVDELESLNV